MLYIYTFIYSILNYLSFYIKFHSFFFFLNFNEKLCYLPQWYNHIQSLRKENVQGTEEISFTSSTSSLCLLSNWRASETLTGVKMKKSGMFIYLASERSERS